MKRSPVRFIHRTPQLFNLGDLLCSPRHYFRFVPGTRPLTILGGGAFNDFGAEDLSRRQIEPRAAVLWGTGASWTENLAPKEIEQLPYAAWGLRDRDRVAENRFLPCASCMHEMLDLPIDGEDTLVFLNRDPKVTPKGQQAQCSKWAESAGYMLLFNDATEREFLRAWRRAKFVVTNSYHGAYWSFLSGRSVACLGHSSKFASLFVALRLSPDGLLNYDRSRPESFAQTLSTALDRRAFLRLSDASATLQRFRQRNVAFADGLARARLVADWKIRSDHLRKWKSRDIEGRLWPSLRHAARWIVRKSKETESFPSA